MSNDEDKREEAQQALIDAVAEYFDTLYDNDETTKNIQLGAMDEDDETILVIQAYRCKSDRYDNITEAMKVFCQIVDGAISTDNIDAMRPKKILN